jgi:membrane protease YdiL (CAAX protease family)
MGRLATVLLVLAVAPSPTLVLLPVGLLPGYGASRLYRIGLRMARPPTADVGKGMRKEEARRRRRTLTPGRRR